MKTDEREAEEAQKTAEYDAWFRQKVQEGLDSANAGRLIPAEEVEARAAAWRAETLRQLEAPGAAKAYDAWVRQKVQEALDSSDFLTDEEMKAEAAGWRLKARQRRAAEARRAADEAGLGKGS